MTQTSKLTSLALLSSIVLVSCAVTPPSPSTRLTTTADLDQIFERKLEFKNNQYAVIHADGRMSGWFNNTEIEGTWEMQDGYLCRTLTVLPSPETPATDCQELRLQGDKLEIRREKGQGNSATYTIGDVVAS